MISLQNQKINQSLQINQIPKLMMKIINPRVIKTMTKPMNNNKVQKKIKVILKQKKMKKKAQLIKILLKIIKIMIQLPTLIIQKQRKLKSKNKELLHIILELKTVSKVLA